MVKVRVGEGGVWETLGRAPLTPAFAGKRSTRVDRVERAAALTKAGVLKVEVAKRRCLRIWIRRAGSVSTGRAIAAQAMVLLDASRSDALVRRAVVRALGRERAARVGAMGE